MATYEDLIKQKDEIDRKIRIAKDVLRCLRRRAAEKGQYVPPVEYANMGHHLTELQRKSQALQTELGITGRAAKKAEYDRRKNTYEECYVVAAREILSPELEHKIHVSALQRCGRYDESKTGTL